MSGSLADHLRTLPDEALVRLFRARPDLLIPLPGDFSVLATRAQTRLSVARVLESLDLFTLEILDAIRLLGSPVAVDALLTVTAPHVDAARTAVDKLRSLLLVHGPDTTLRPVAAVDEVCSAYPAGLGRPAAVLGDPAAAELAADPAALRRTIISAPPKARSVLEALAAGPPVGTLSDATVEKDDDSSPVRWLLNRRLLVPISDEAVELPREVGLLLRRDGAPLGQLHPEAPPLNATTRVNLDRAGAGHAIELVRMTEAVIVNLPAPILKSGGMGVRDLRRLAKAIDSDERTTALLLEVGHAAGLIGVLET
ncbi:MAG: hypothetical protein H0T78_03150, partial [Longispora sp.]|nr:hypothetical protein [Longispora sp. (in: high G+C Gram-positive bacteria)]